MIAGRSGTGKSTLCAELVARGLPAFDGDNVAGLARWIDLRSGLPVKIDYSKPIDLEKYDWCWDEAVLKKFLASQSDLYLCGSAGNQLDFTSLFDKIFVLTLDAVTQIDRIMNRTSHNYGKRPEMHAAIIQDQAAFVAQALEHGAIPIDASPRPAAVADTIMEHIREG